MYLHCFHKRIVLLCVWVCAHPVLCFQESKFQQLTTHSLALGICLKTHSFYSADVFQMFKNDSYNLLPVLHNGFSIIYDNFMYNH
jgi:hypothetical protein